MYNRLSDQHAVACTNHAGTAVCIDLAKSEFNIDRTLLICLQVLRVIQGLDIGGRCRGHQPAGTLGIVLTRK